MIIVATITWSTGILVSYAVPKGVFSNFAITGTSGTLPPGITLNEETLTLVGTPTTAGFFQWTYNWSGQYYWNGGYVEGVWVNPGLRDTSGSFTINFNVADLPVVELQNYQTVDWRSVEVPLQGWYGNLPGGLNGSWVTVGLLSSGSGSWQISGTVNCPPGIYTTSFAIFVVSAPNALDAPVITCDGATLANGVNTLTVDAGTVNLQFSASNSGGSWQASLPPGCSINSFGHVSGTLSPGSYSIVVQCQNYAWAQDNYYTHGPTQTATYALHLVVTPALPVISTNYYNFSGNYIVGSDLPNAAVVQVQDYAKPVVWSASGLPDGVAINPQSGALTGKLSVPGDYNITITATNSTGATDYAQRITVLPTQAVPVVSLAAQQPGAASEPSYGQPPKLKFEAGAAVKIFHDATNDPTAWSASDLPLGLSIDADTGTVSGIIRAPGNYRFFVTATNSVGDSDPLGVTVTATGRAQAFQFISADPTLTDLQIDIRSGAVNSSRDLSFKQFTKVRLALVWLDFGSPVDPPSAATIKMAIRAKDQFEADPLFPAVSATLVPATETQPAYLLIEQALQGDALAAQCKSLLDPQPATPMLEVMADVTWVADGILCASQTIYFTIAPAVTY